MDTQVMPILVMTLCVPVFPLMSINLLDKLIPDLFEVIQDDAVGYICLKNIEYSKMSTYDISIVTKIIDNLIETLESIQANYQNHLKVKIEN